MTDQNMTDRNMMDLDMVDIGTLQRDLQQARKARLEAQASACDIETLLDTVRGSERAWYRLPFGRDAVKPDLLSLG